MLHELKKVKVLSTKEEKFEMNKDESMADDDSDDETRTPKNDELMKLLEKKHARFVVCDENRREINEYHKSSLSKRKEEKKMAINMRTPNFGRGKTLARLQTQVSLPE